MIFPFFVIICQITWLAMSKEHWYDTIYYKYVAADMFINIMAGWTYLNKLQRIQFE